MLDDLRLAAVALGMVELALLAWVLFRHHAPRDRGFVVLAWLLSVPLIFTETEQVGRPFVWWRLPMILGGFVAGIVIVVRRMGRDARRRRK